MFALCDIQDVGCSVGGLFRIWGFWRNVGCSRVKMIWDAGCSGCWMFQM